MTRLFKRHSFGSSLTKWYIGVFTIVVLGFTSAIYYYISSQTWDKFNLGVSALGEEMLEEVSELRDDLKSESFDSLGIDKTYQHKYDVQDFGQVKWTESLLAELRSGIEQEIIDESIDNHLEDIGYVQVSNLISDRMLYQSPEIEENQLEFISPPASLWGYHPFEYKTDSGVLLHGLGYFGVRIIKNYFIGLIPANYRQMSHKSSSRKLAFTVYEIAESVSRRADSLYMKNETDLLQLLEEIDAWAYIYIYEEDRVLWSTKKISKSDVYIPSEEITSGIFVLPKETVSKEYYFDISDTNNREYRQYTLIYDIIPSYLYKMDLAVPTDSIRKQLATLAVYFIIGSLLLIGIVWIGGYVLMRRALRPVDEIIHSVNEITSKNLDKRLPVPNLENEIMRLVNTFNALLDRLAKSFKMQKAFIADASHELRTPLSIILSDIETAKQNEKNNKPGTDALDNAVAEIERMARIVNDLDLLARSDAGQLIMNRQHIRLDEVLMTTLSRCQVLAKDKKIMLELEQVEGIEYRGDEELLVRALSNLVQNAIKYSDKNQKVRLSLNGDNRLAYITVSDDGIGIAQKSHEKIFDRFYRIDSSRSRKTGGSGLGLAISKWIVESHGGEISVNSAPGKGSIFRIDLPLKY